MEYEFLSFFFLVLFAVSLWGFFYLISKLNNISNTLNNVSFEISTLKLIIEKMQRENQKQAELATETKPKENIEQPKEKITETPKEVHNESVSPNPNWWQQPITNETPTTEKAEGTETTGENEQPELQETPETIEVPIVHHEDIRPSIIEIPIEETEDKTPEVEKETPDTIEEPVEEEQEEPAMAMEEEEKIEEYTTSETNFEKYIGENLFGKIGILIFIIGIGFFVKYAIDQNWINETARTLMGYAVGAGMLVLAERLHKRYHTFSSLLAGGAFGIYYLITAIAFHYYDLFSHTMAFVILCATTIFMSAVSVLYDRKELAVTALVGGFIAPFIISTDSSSIISLQIYIGILNIGMFCLAMYKKWAILPMVSFGFTYIILWGTTAIGSFTDNEAVTIYPTLFAFATLFYVIFLLPIVFILRTQYGENTRLGLLGIITANSFMYLIYGDFLLQHFEASSDTTAYLAFFIAGVNLAIHLYLRFRVEGQDTLRNLMLGLAVTFASMGIPILFSTANVLMVWAAEAVLLLWLFTKEKNRIYEWASAILLFLTMGALAYYRTTDTFIHNTGDSLFFNGAFFVTTFVSIAYFVAAVIMQYNKEFFSDMRRLIAYTPCNAIAYALGFSILFLAFRDNFHFHLEQPISEYASLLTANIMLLGGALILHKRFEISKNKLAYEISLYLAGILFAMTVWNDTAPDGLLLRWLMALVTIAYMAYCMRGQLLVASNPRSLHTEYAIVSTLTWLTLTRLLLITFNEVNFSTAFSLSLGIAAFILMCIGMRYHSKEIRIVSLAEFGIIIGKLILNDVWAMSALGKIIVFISLGAILLILSFLYQKLKDALFNEEKQEQE
jgi:putative membrane protein